MITRGRVLRALCRFDIATAEDVAGACGTTAARISGHLRRLIEAGLAQKLSTRLLSYVPTEAGRQAAKQ